MDLPALSPSVVRQALLAAVAALLFGNLSAATAKSRAPESDAPKTHVLFMGADISLERGNAVHLVNDVTSTALVIKPDGKRVDVPLLPGINLLINEALKIAETTVDLSDLEADRAYSAGNDPFRRLAASVTLAAGESALADLAQGEMVRTQMALMGKMTPEEREAAVAKAQEAEEAAMRAFNTPPSQTYDATAQSVKLSDETYDAIRVSFEVKSEKNLRQAYYAIIAQIREPGSKPGQARKWAYVKSLGTVTAGIPKEVSIFQGGLPPGYILENCEVHIYDHGQELATSHSRKRVPLTDHEALQYRVIEHIGANKGRTLPASLASAKLARENLGQFQPAVLSETYYVRVTRDGTIVAAFHDRGGKEPVRDKQLDATLKMIRFLPALEAGKPVESVAPLKLDELPAT